MEPVSETIVVDTPVPGSPNGGPIVVGVDGSDVALHGLEFAAGLASTLGVDLVVVHVLRLITRFEGSIEPTAGHEGEIAEVLRTTWCAPLGSWPDLSWTSEVVNGQEVDGLLDAAHRVRAAMIVVGSHGAGGGAERLLGSTSQRVVRESSIPIVVVPPHDNSRRRRTLDGQDAPAQER